MAKEKTGQEILAKELRSLIPKLDEEGLAFLVEQAKVHLYNMEVDKLNQAAADINKTPQRKPGLSEKTSAPFRIEPSESGSSCYIVCGTDWVMFSKDEMRCLAGIAGAPGDNLEIRGRLFNWFKRERSDFLNTAFIKNKFDDKLKILAALINNPAASGRGMLFS
jgi:hypothetical protein